VAVPLVEGQNVVPITITDEVGHVTAATRTFIYDTTPPSGSVLSPAAGAFVRGVADLVVSATDNLTGVAALTVSIDGGPATTPQPASGHWLDAIDTTTLADGAHTAVTTLVDGVGNTSTLSTRFVVDNTPPTATLTGPAPNGYLPGVITISATASDAGSGVGAVVLAVNGAVIGRCAGAGACSATFDTRTLADGPFQISATATDVAGNTGAPATQTDAAVNNAPSKFLISPLQGAIVAGSMTVAVSTADPYFSSVQCFVDGVSLGVSTSPSFQQSVDLLHRLDGTSTVRCVATDLAGNVGVQTATVTVKNWNSTLNPTSIYLTAAQTSTTVLFSVDGPADNMKLLLPWAPLGLTLVVPGGAPVPLSGTALPQQYPHGTRLNIVFYFDRAAFIASIKAGIASGAIDPTKPVNVQLMSRGVSLGHDLLGVNAPAPARI
jgi:hypothetical protein